MFLKNAVPKESFSFVVSDVVPILYNEPCYVLEINIFGRGYSSLNLFDYSNYSLPKIIISKTCARFIVENLDNIGCSLMHLKKSVMRLQITAFKSCNKWTPVYKY